MVSTIFRDVPDGKEMYKPPFRDRQWDRWLRGCHLFTKNILPIIDFGIDFHTGGQNHFNYPQIRYTKADEKSRVLAEAFAAPVTISTKETFILSPCGNRGWMLAN
ncbi:MAG: hypothetical protein R2825_18205 [Saprospiraceae bacterium]